MRRLRILIAGVALLAAASPAAAQRITFDLRGAVAAPLEKLAGTELNTGYGLGATIAYRLQEHLHVYGGWDLIHFSSDNSFAGADMDFEETGYTFGLRFEHPIANMSRTSFRVEGGGTFQHIEIENTAGDIIGDSGHEMGFEVGAGFLIPIGTKWSVTPTLRYRSLTNDFLVGSSTTDVNLRYAALEFGFSRRF
jgi:hypothetical protein